MQKMSVKRQGGSMKVPVHSKEEAKVGAPKVDESMPVPSPLDLDQINAYEEEYRKHQSMQADSTRHLMAMLSKEDTPFDQQKNITPENQTEEEAQEAKGFQTLGYQTALQEVKSQSFTKLIITLINILKNMGEQLTDSMIENEIAKYTIITFKIQEQEHLNMTFNDLRYFPDKKAIFKQSMQEIFSSALNIKKEDVQVFGLVKGSIKVHILIKEFNYRARDQIFIRDVLREKGLEPQEVQAIEPNFLIEGFHFNEVHRQYSWMDFWLPRYRGPANNRRLFYVPPPPWFKIGITVRGQYDEGNDEWLSSSTAAGAWHVVYYACSQLEEIDFNEILISKKIKPNKFQPYKNKNCQETGLAIGEGIYCFSRVEVAQRECKIFDVDDHDYQLVLQCRVRPGALKQANHDTFVVNDPSDIRPYGLVTLQLRQRWE